MISMDCPTPRLTTAERTFPQRTVFPLLLLLGVFCAPMLHAAQSAQKPAKAVLERVRISQSAVAARSTVLWIAQEKGLFAKHGIDMEVVYLRSSPLQMTALSTGEVQFASSGGSPLLFAVSGGQDLKVIASQSNRLSYDLVVRPEIKEAKGLRGRRFGVTTFGGTTWMATYLTLEHLGLDASRDHISINALGNQTILAQAVESGNIDATLLDPFLSRGTKAKGLPVLIELHRAKIPFMNSAVAASGNYLREHPEIVEGVLKALIEAQAFVAAPANRAAVLQTMSRHMKLSNPALLEDGYQDLQVGVEKKPYPQLDGLRNIQRIMATLNPKVKGVRVEDLIDTRFIRKVDESAFIDALYKG